MVSRLHPAGVDGRNNLQEQSEVCKSSLFGSLCDASQDENLYSAVVTQSFTVPRRKSFANASSSSLHHRQTCLPSASGWEAPKTAGTILSSTDSRIPVDAASSACRSFSRIPAPRWHHIAARVAALFLAEGPQPLSEIGDVVALRVVLHRGVAPWRYKRESNHQSGCSISCELRAETGRRWCLTWTSPWRRLSPLRLDL